MNPIDKEAYELAITIASRDPVERRRNKARFAKGESFRRSAETARIHASAIRSFHALATSAEPRRQPFDVERATRQCQRESAELLLRTKRLGISVWHPDPFKECERASRPREQR
jgi:hypothetical protein